MKTIQFKSNPENFRKEYIGTKSNTVRKVSVEDYRKEILDDWISGNLTCLNVEIINSKDFSQVFTIPVTDVTYFEGVYIISW